MFRKWNHSTPETQT